MENKRQNVFGVSSTELGSVTEYDKNIDGWECAVCVTVWIIYNLSLSFVCSVAFENLKY